MSTEVDWSTQGLNVCLVTLNGALANANEKALFTSATLQAYLRAEELDRKEAAVWRKKLTYEARREFLREVERVQREDKARSAHGSDAPQPANDPPARRVLDWRALSASNPPDREWGIEHWLPFAPTLVAGPGGVGKSLLMQTIGTALGNVTHFADRIPRPLRVLMWACEDEHDELWRRQVAVCSAFGITLASLPGRFDLESRVGQDNTLFATDFGRPMWTSKFQELREQVNDLRADVLILDNVRQVYGANEIDPHCVSVFVNGLMTLRTDAPFVPIMTGHTARSQGSEFAGTAQWENAVRARWYFGASLPDRKIDDADDDSRFKRALPCQT